MIGLAGTVARVQELARQLRKTPDVLHIKIPKDEELNALVVYPDGVVRELDGAGWIEVKAKYYAIGSGSTAAMVAMECGKSAADAVRIAMKFDNNTGGKVQSVKLKRK